MTVKYIASNYGSIGTLDASITSSETEFDVTGSSAKLASLTSGQGYLLCLGDPAGTREFIQCTTFSANHFAGVTRGFESSKNGGIARGWPSGTPVTMIISAAYLDNIPQFSDVIGQTEAEAGTATTGWLWSALRVRQAIIAYVTGGFSINLNNDTGHIKLPSFLGGLIIQWATGPIDPADDSEPWHTIGFSITFPNEIFIATVSTEIIDTEFTDTSHADYWYQTFQHTTSTARVKRQHNGSAAFALETRARIIAIGR